MFTIKNILVPTDFSAHAHKALIHAVNVAKKYDAQIILLHVIDVHIQQCVVDYCLSDAVMKQLEEEGLKTSNQKLKDEIEDVLSNPNGIHIVPAVRRGIPYDEILKAQEENAIDLIVIASHGRSGILKNLIGSVTEKIVRTANCPVMVIRG